MDINIIHFIITSKLIYVLWIHMEILNMKFQIFMKLLTSHPNLK